MTAPPHGSLIEALADRYRVEGEIGSGGAAIVYRADDLRHERAVAIKVMRQDVADALGAHRFLREIEVVAGLAHPHILPLLDSGTAGAFTFHVTPWIATGSLRARLERDPQLPV